jgi:cytidyltransferase-like protein
MINEKTKKVIIIPGSFKPPHKGHLHLLEKRIQQKKQVDKIIIIISKKVRPLDKRFLYMNEVSKEELQEGLIEYFPSEKKKISEMKKSILIKYINQKIKENKIQNINAEQSLKIWNIYLDYLKEKYEKQIPIIEFRISPTNNIIIETNRVILELFREKIYKKIILMKSEKNSLNKRFDYFEKQYSKYVQVKLFPNIKDIDATGMREAILKNDKIWFFTYLPNDLENKKKQKIWKIVNSK